MNYIIIFIMSFVTFSVRYSFFSSILNFKISSTAKSFLSFTAPCVLSAMTAPIVFSPVDAPFYTNPYVIGAVSTVVFSLVFNKTLVIVFLGLGVFFAVNYLF